MSKTTKDSSPKSDSHDRILGNRSVTDKKLFESVRAAPNFRGDLLILPAEPMASDSALFAQLEATCAPKAIAVTELSGGELRLTADKGRCIMCGMCQQVAPGVFKIQNTFAKPVKSRPDLIVAGLPETNSEGQDLSHEAIGKQLREKIKSVLGHSLAIREVDAGSCNGCEVEVSALTNPVYDIERFGIHFVASPRHADVLLVTGVGSRNMELALRRTYDATPDPKVVVAVGACACTGGLFGDSYATSGGISKIVPVDVFVPGCPPRPEALLYGLLLAVDRIH